MDQTIEILKDVVKRGKDDPVDPKTHLVLKSENSDVEYVMPKAVAVEMSSFIKGMLETEEKDELLVLPLPEEPKVGQNALPYVIAYMQHHHNNRAKPIEKPLKGKITDHITKWDKAFLFTDLVFVCIEIKNGVESDSALFFQVMNAANFLGVQDLLDLVCPCFAGMLKDKTPEQIRETFNLPDDLTAEQKEKIKRENRWLEESS